MNRKRITAAFYFMDLQEHKTALITGCLGDIVDLSAWLTDDERSTVETILWASPQQGPEAESLIGLFMPNIKNHVQLWPGWIGRPHHYMNTDEVNHDLSITQGRQLPPHVDWSVERIWSQCDEFRTWHNLLGRLPEDGYWAVQAFSSHDAGEWRDFAPHEWSALTDWLERSNQRAVILGTGNQPVPSHKRITNMVNRTSILEAIDITRAARGVLGIHSFLASVGTKLFDSRHLAVRIRAAWPKRYLRARYGDLESWPFVGCDLATQLTRLEVPCQS